VGCECPYCRTVPRQAPQIAGRILDAQWAAEQRAWNRKVSVTIDEEEVANDCTLAGEGPDGFVYLLRRDDQGHLQVCPQWDLPLHVCMEVRRGKVRVLPEGL
jgi:hypothetical protein